MAILNITPDSFSDGGRYLDPAAAIAHARRLRSEGADILDIGGESTRPGAEAVAPTVQIERVVPVIRALAESDPDFMLSIDTQSADVARAALDAGATMVNDVSALRSDPRLPEVVANAGADVVLMHMQGTPRTMQRAPNYEDIILEVAGFFEARIAAAEAAGIARDKITIDPGIGFGKSVAHNLRLIAELARFTRLAPVLLGTSRKSFIGRILDLDDPQDRETGTTVTHVFAALAGASIIRVHDVTRARQAITMARAIMHPEERE